MVGRSCAAEKRFAEVTASARSLPSRTSGNASDAGANSIVTRPASTSGTAVATPLYGMCRISRPAADFSSSAAICGELPLPPEAKVSSPGVVRASLISSRAYANGCSYRRRLEAWLGAEKIHPDRAIAFQSYHAIIACVAAGSGIAVVPTSMVRKMDVARELNVVALPAATARADTQLV